MVDTSDIGKKVWDINEEYFGVIIGITHRWCRDCKKDHKVFLIDWMNGKKSKPCITSLEKLDNGDYHVIWF